MTVTPIRPHSRSTTTPVDFEALTEAEVRVIFYAANFHRTYNDDTSPDGGIGRMMATITAVINDLGIDLIRQVGDLAAHALLARNYQLEGHLFPDTNRWNWTKTNAGVFLRAMAHHPAPLTAHTVAHRWHAALTSGTRTATAVA
ncbi:hypothetical protein OG470_19625 [Micromonospora sp. NBC_00389]|uniref:hypothetical protein n=1 Tax=Micromonospora sp. NBC_00389 TaxID=2903586 RepID=UPI002E202132